MLPPSAGVLPCKILRRVERIICPIFCGFKLGWKIRTFWVLTHKHLTSSSFLNFGHWLCGLMLEFVQSAGFGQEIAFLQGVSSGGEVYGFPRDDKSSVRHRGRTVCVLLEQQAPVDGANIAGFVALCGAVDLCRELGHRSIHLHDVLSRRHAAENEDQRGRSTGAALLRSAANHNKQPAVAPA